MNMYASWFGLVLLILACNSVAAPPEPWVVYDGYDGPGNGKHVVLISGDEEYRSEEALPQLGKILARRHGFKCTVLFAIDPEDGMINPVIVNNIPGLEALQDADLMVIFTRYRELPDAQMRHIVEYLDSGRPIIGMRTATHAFKYSEGATSAFRHYDCKDTDWDGGFGRQVLGETWVTHHGHHKVQSTLGLIAKDMRRHPIVRGCENIWGPTDTYTVNLPVDCTPLVLGQVLAGMNKDDAPVAGEYVRKLRNNREERKRPNDPMQPVAWIRSYTGPFGNTSRIFNTTMGASIDLKSEGLRRLLVNAVYWGLEMEEQIPPRANVDIVGKFQPTFFGFGEYTKGLAPSDHAMP